MKKIALYIGCMTAVLLLQTACSPTIPADPKLASIDTSKLPPANLSLQIPGLSPCTTQTDSTLQINSDEPVNIIVHGCFGSAARFRALAQVFAFHGQQTACFNYDDRDDLIKSSAELVEALNTLSAKMNHQQITVIGHSQGGLVARKALVVGRERGIHKQDLPLRLVTISTPFAGIAAADHCGSYTARLLSLGLVMPICQIISGDKWDQIPQNSSFIQKPGELLAQVDSHLKIITDESGTCRHYNDLGSCVEDDFVFSLDEQYFGPVDSSAQVQLVEVHAGHVEIVGDDNIPPEKLIAQLQRNGIMNKTDAAQRNNLSVFLSSLYHVQKGTTAPDTF